MLLLPFRTVVSLEHNKIIGNPPYKASSFLEEIREQIKAKEKSFINQIQKKNATLQKWDILDGGKIKENIEKLQFQKL